MVRMPNTVTEHWVGLVRSRLPVLATIDRSLERGLKKYPVLRDLIPVECMPFEQQGNYHKIDVASFLIQRMFELRTHGLLSTGRMDSVAEALNAPQTSYGETYSGPRPVQFNSDHTALETPADMYDNTPTIEEHIMAHPDIEIKTITFVNGADVTTLSLDAKVNLIANLEARIVHLEAIHTHSNMVKKEVSRLSGELERLVALFDSQEEGE